MIRIVIIICVYSFLGWLLCDIDPDKYYTWYAGLWHGLFFIPNLIRSWLGDALYKANDYSTAYNIWWWITTVWSCLGFLFGSNGGRQQSYR